MLCYVMNVCRHNSDVQFPTNGRVIRSARRGNGSGTSVGDNSATSNVTYDYLGKPL